MDADSPRRDCSTRTRHSQRKDNLVLCLLEGSNHLVTGFCGGFCYILDGWSIFLLQLVETRGRGCLPCTSVVSITLIDSPMESSPHAWTIIEWLCPSARVHEAMMMQYTVWVGQKPKVSQYYSSSRLTFCSILIRSSPIMSCFSTGHQQISR